MTSLCAALYSVGGCGDPLTAARRRRRPNRDEGDSPCLTCSISPIGIVGFLALWGDHEGAATGSRRPTMFDYIVSGIVAVLLLVYLGWAMFQPEKF